MSALEDLLRKYAGSFAPVVPLDESDRLAWLDLSGANDLLKESVFNDLDAFSRFIESLLRQSAARYGVGGYLENRKVYNRSRVFDAAVAGAESRTLHLGIDIWGDAGTPVMAPLPGRVHSTGYHPEAGNYGGTVILEHSLDGLTFYSLYGHLRRADSQLSVGEAIGAGEVFAALGEPPENGYWPPHLHVQVMAGLQGHFGDYPGVCALSDAAAFAANCPDPDLLLDLRRRAASGMG